MSTFSFLLAFLLAAVHINLTLAVPVENNNAYSGAGGQSPGGSVNNSPYGGGGGGLFRGGPLNVFSSTCLLRLTSQQILTKYVR